MNVLYFLLTLVMLGVAGLLLFIGYETYKLIKMEWSFDFDDDKDIEG